MIGLAVLFPIILGFVVVHLLLPREKPLIVALLSVGIGYGVTSWIVLFLLLAAGQASRGILLAEAAAIFAGAILAYRRRRRPHVPARIQIKKFSRRLVSLETALILGFIAVAVLAAARYVLSTRMAPYGSFDAWESYNMKARFILLSGKDWKQLFTTLPDPVPDYPLFLPLSVAGVLMSIGKDSLAVPAALAVLFICATVGLLLATLGEARWSRSQAAMAGMVLLGTPFFVHLSFAQYADIPLAFFFLATMALLFLHATRGPVKTSAGDLRGTGLQRDHGNSRLLIAAGLTAGLSAWVKNEGLVFFPAVCITYFVFSWRTVGRRDAIRRLRMFLSGGAGPVILALLFKMTFAGTNALVATQGRAGMMRKLLMPHRYLEVLEGFGYHLYHLASWPESILLLLAVYALILGVRVEKRERCALLTCAATLLIMLGVYFVVLVGSPYDTPPFDVSWYILVTAPRLFMQLWPCFLLVFFLTVRTPDEIIDLLRSKSAPSAS
jgi:4-amino-4-deoxy-L-arabinose transferase-like glycosyltransferase